MSGRNKKNRAKTSDSVFFWETARRFLDHELPKIRKKSRNTIATYRASLNICIGFLEDVKGVPRECVCFDDLDKENLKDYLVWMGDVREWSPKTCNLRMTAVRSPVILCIGRVHGHYPHLCLKQSNTQPECPMRGDHVF